MFRATGNGNVPLSISELLTARNSNYNLRGDAILKLPKVNSTKYGIKSWRYQRKSVKSEGLYTQPTSSRWENAQTSIQIA